MLDSDMRDFIVALFGKVDKSIFKSRTPMRYVVDRDAVLTECGEQASKLLFVLYLKLDMMRITYPQQCESRVVS